jgi:hypothetical protein
MWIEFSIGTEAREKRAIHRGSSVIFAPGRLLAPQVRSPQIFWSFGYEATPRGQNSAG